MLLRRKNFVLDIKVLALLISSLLHFGSGIFCYKSDCISIQFHERMFAVIYVLILIYILKNSLRSQHVSLRKETTRLAQYFNTNTSVVLCIVQ